MSARDILRCGGAPGTIEHMFPSTGMPCECERCGRRYRCDHRRGHTKRICNSCMSNQHRHALKAELVRLKGGGCEICGYRRCARALTFHHLDAATKSFHVAGSHCRSIKRLHAEVKKCVLLCENCHREVEDGIAMIPDHVRARIEAHLVDVPRRARRRAGRPPLDPWELEQGNAR